MTTPMDLDESTNSTMSAPTDSIRAANALSKLAESDSASEKATAPVRKAGGLLTRLRVQSDESSEDEEDAVDAAEERTKRRFMPTTPIEDTSSEGEDEDDDGEAAYLRMKQRMAGAGPQQAQDHPVPEQKTAPKFTVPTSSEDEDDAPVRATKSRRLQPRKEKTASPDLPSPIALSRHSSPGIFVTPNASPVKRQTHAGRAEDDSDQSVTRKRTADIEERRQRIRAGRLAARAHEQERRKNTRTRHRDAEEDSQSNSDGESGRRLTQQAKPTRKAGKKAMEAMVREQQKIERNMQLTHQSKTKKKFGVKDLFAKFGYNDGTGLETTTLPTPDTSSIPTSPDVEEDQSHETPPTSPPSFDDAPQKDMLKDIISTGVDTRAAAGLVDDTASSAQTKLDKGKGRAPEFRHLPQNPLVEHSQRIAVRNARVEPTESTTAAMVELSDSEDDLQVVQPKSRYPVFDRLPEKQKQEAPSLLHLRHLAQLISPGKKGLNGRKSMNMMQLQRSLHQKSREQARKERGEKIEELKRRGIHVETEEEIAARQLDLDDSVERLQKAHEENNKLAKREREQAKRNGESVDDLPSSDESDHDWEENAADGEDSANEHEELASLDLSGSEDEEEADADDEEDGVDEEELDGEETVDNTNGLVDNITDQDEEEASGEVSQQAQLEDAMFIDDDEPEAPARTSAIQRTRKLIVDDEDEDEDEAPQAGSPTQLATQDDAMAAFGFGNAAPTLGLTQAFAGTMANLDSGSQDDALHQEPEQNSLDFLRSLPDTQPGANFSQADLPIAGSQAIESQQGQTQDADASQFNLGISQMFQTSPAFSRTQLSEVPEPTQDAGFLLSRSPTGLRAPHSTIDTVLFPVADPPMAERKGKLRRRHRETIAELSDVDDDNVASDSDLEAEQRLVKAHDAFSVMKKAAKKQQKEIGWDKDEREEFARDYLEQQANESEDEYAGIGGADDDDSENEEDLELAEMIDTSNIKVNERQIAAFAAEQSLKDHEKGIAKLNKDIETHRLGKRAGNFDDMSDSEDERERRRRKKQREFQLMANELTKDERIGKLATNAKKQPFFQSMIDLDDGKEYDFLNNPEQPAAQETQSQSDENNEDEEISVPDSQTADATIPIPMNPLKRKSTDSQEKENRPPPHLRRTAASDTRTRKPMSMSDIQHSVSELLDDPRIVIPDSQYVSDSEDDTPATFPSTTTRATIIDRLSLSRSSTTMSATASASMAFVAPATSHTPGFRVPSLVRRATSNFSTVSERSSGASTPVESVRRGGTGKSNIHAQAREAERRAVVDKVEGKRREALKKKVGKARGGRSVLRDLGGGFE